MVIVSFSLFINVILLKFATTLGIRSNEKPVVRWSSVAKPALGGISFYIAYLMSMTCFSVFFDESLVFKELSVLGALGATALAFLMGLADDAYDTRPLLKFGIQLLCGIILIISGTYINISDYNYINWILTILWVIGMMNAINMLDNMDGITSIVSSSIIITALVALTFNGNFQNFDFMASLGIVAALIGFLFFNWHPSKMYMGDTGSQFIGMFVAYIGIKYVWNGELFSGENSVFQQLSLVLVVFILPIVDTTVVFINRLARKQSPFRGGKDHTTHHLSYLGLSDSQVGFTYMGISAVSLLFSIAIYRFVDVWLWYHTLGCGIYFVATFAVLFFVTQRNKDKRT